MNEHRSGDKVAPVILVLPLYAFTHPRYVLRIRLQDLRDTQILRETQKPEERKMLSLSS